MPRLATAIGTLTLCGALLMAAPGAAHAQAPYQPPTNSFDVTVYGGWDFPTLDIQDAASAGPMVGLSVAPRLHEQVTLRFDGNASFLQSADYPDGIEGPSVTIYRGLAGLEVNLFDPKLTKWRVLVNGALGWSFLSSGDLPQTDEVENTEGISTDGFTARTGMKVGYPVTNTATVYFGADAYFHNISGSEDTRRLQLLNRDELSTWKPSWTIPVQLGVRIGLN